MSEGLVQWLPEQLDEDERLAREAAEPEQWVELNRAPQQSWSVEYWTSPDRAAVVAEESSAHPVVVTTQGMAEADAEARVAHIARHDPARVLREIDAKRELLRQHDHLKHEVMPDDLTGVWALEAALRAVATVYADRPGYRDEWRP